MNFERHLAGLLALFLWLGMGASVHADSPRLLVWINGDKGYKGLQAVGDAFERETGVKVVVQFPEDAPSKFQQAAAAAKGPDIFCWPHDRTGEWAKGGLIVPIRPQRKIRDSIDESAWRAFQYQGQLWGYPLAMESIGLIYNRRWVKQAPRTWDDVLALDKDLAKQGKKAILWNYTKSFFTWPMMAGAGGFIFGRSANGDFDPSQVGVNQEGAVQAAQTLKNLVASGVMPKGASYAEMEAGFAKGEVAMMISGPWAWDNARRAGIDFGVATLPGLQADAPGKPFVGVLGCLIAAPSPVKDIAKEFIEQHLLRVDSLKLINDDVPLGVPANKAFYAELASNPHIRATMDNVRRGEPIPNVPEVGRFWTAMDAALEAITNGLQSPDQALRGAADRMTARQR